jgi:hypothetical protein
MALEAYRWWNASVDPFEPSDCPPFCIAPGEAVAIWNRFCPILGIATCPAKPTSVYWQDIARFLLKLCESHEIPSPRTRFPDFVVLLHRLRDRLCPGSVSSYLTFLDQFKYTNLSQFLLYQSPLVCLDPLLWITTLLTLMDRSAPLWDRFVNDSSSVDGFFGLYVTFLKPVPDADSIVRHHHIILGEIFFKILKATTRTNPANSKLASVYCNFLVNSLSSAPAEFEVSIVRWIVTITALTAAKTEPSQMKERMQSLLGRIGCKSPSFPYFIRWLASEDAQFVTSKILFRWLKLECLEVVNFIELIARKYGGLLPIIRLATEGLKNKVMHRVCFQAIRNIILQLPDSIEVKDWVLVCLRRLVIFVGLSAIRQKYRNRSVLICESLSFFACMQIAWLSDAVAAAGAAIGPTRCVPDFFWGFVRNYGNPDDLTLAEYNAFLKQKLVLKSFPFEPDKWTFVLPVMIEGNMSGPAFPSILSVFPPAKPARPSVGSWKKKIAPVIRKPKVKGKRAMKLLN